jgi:uncharacterized membrane protein
MSLDGPLYRDNGDRESPNLSVFALQSKPCFPMSMLAFAFILTAAGIHATWNLLAKRLDGGSESVWLFTLIATIVYAPPTLFIIMSTSFRPGFREGVILVGTGVLQAVYFVLLRRGYAAGDLSVVYPLARGIGPLAATMLAVALLTERQSFVTVTGALTVSLGTLLLVRRSQGATASRALLYGVTTGLVIGCYTVWDGYAVGELAIPAIIVGWAADAGRLSGCRRSRSGDEAPCGQHGIPTGRRFS